MLGFIISLLRRIPLRGWLGVGALAAVVALGLYVRSVRRERDAALASSANAVAALDSARVVGVWNDLELTQRLAFQEEAVAGLRDSLARARGRTRALTALLAAPRRVDTVQVGRPAAVDSAGAIVATDSVVGPPVDVRATARITGPRADWSWSVRPRPIPLVVDVGCRGRLKPDVVVGAPTWVTIDSVGTRVGVDVCGGEISRRHGAAWWVIRIVGLGAVFGAGVAVGS